MGQRPKTRKKQPSLEEKRELSRPRAKQKKKAGKLPDKTKKPI